MFLVSGLKEITTQLLKRPIPVVVHGYDYPVPDGRGFLGGDRRGESRGGRGPGGVGPRAGPFAVAGLLIHGGGLGRPIPAEQGGVVDERRAVADIGRNRFRGLDGAVNEKDFARTAPHHGREGNCAPDIPSADDTQTHEGSSSGSEHV